MARVTPQEYVEKHARRLKQSLPDIKTGIERVTIPPGQAAAREEQRMLTNTMEAIQSGKWATRVGAVSLQDWQKATIDKGLSRIPAGVDAAMVKNVPMAERLLTAVDAAAAKAKALPKGTIEDSISRASMFMREMHGAKIK